MRSRKDQLACRRRAASVRLRDTTSTRNRDAISERETQAKSRAVGCVSPGVLEREQESRRGVDRGSSSDKKEETSRGTDHERRG